MKMRHPENWYNPMCDSTLTCYNSGIDTEETLPNKHLDHLEDLIFVGRKEALEAVVLLSANLNLVSSGTVLPLSCSVLILLMASSSSEPNPFSIKSRSRSVILRQILTNIIKGNVANILRLCFYHLPRLSGIIQFDLDRCRRGSVYRPNTLEYRFSSPIRRDIILAPHTSYTEVSPTAVGVAASIYCLHWVLNS